MLYDEKKYTHKKSQVGKSIGSQSKLTNYEYGRKKAKSIALSKKMGKKDKALLTEARRLTQHND